MTDRIVLVGCGDAKRDSPQPAYALYDSIYFQKKMCCAMLLGKPAILSAKYGFVWPDEKLEPYDETVGEKTREGTMAWAEEVAETLFDIHPEEVVFLAGKDYREPIKEYIDTTYNGRPFIIHDPFADTSGIGEQQEWLTEAINTLEQGNLATSVLSYG